MGNTLTPRTQWVRGEARHPGTQWVRVSGTIWETVKNPGKRGTQWGKCSHVPGKLVQWRRFRLSRAREPLIQYDLKRVFYFRIPRFIYPRSLTKCHHCANLSGTWEQ